MRVAVLCFIFLFFRSCVCCCINVQIREYHRRHPAARVVDANEEFEALLKEEPQIEFSGEVSLSH